MRSKKFLIVAIVAVLVIVLVVFGNSRGFPPNEKPTPTPQIAASGFSIVIEEENSSGQNGIVTFEPKGSQTIVKIKSVGYTYGVLQPAHIHSGTCSDPGEVKYPLVSLRDGASETTLNVNIEDFHKTSFLILNVHKSNEEINIYTSCGIVKPQ